MLLHKIMHNPVMAHLREPRHADYSKLVLRFALGAIFMAHGWQKVNDLAAVAAYFGKLGIPAPGSMAVLVMIFELVGGLAIIFGLATRVWAAGQAIIMIVAILATSMVWNVLEVALMAMALSLAWSGAGSYSLDAWLLKKSMKEHGDALPMPKA